MSSPDAIRAEARSLAQFVMRYREPSVPRSLFELAVSAGALVILWVAMWLSLGIGYWLTLLYFGTSPAALLQVMPIAAGTAFGILFIAWLVAMRASQGKPGA